VAKAQGASSSVVGEGASANWLQLTSRVDLDSLPERWLGRPPYCPVPESAQQADVVVEPSVEVVRYAQRTKWSLVGASCAHVFRLSEPSSSATICCRV
jgi:hypothetical protein